MDSKKAIILILGLFAMVLLFSSEVTARVLTENFSNTKRGDVKKINEVNKASYVNGGYGYPYNGGGYFSGYAGNGGGYGGGYPGNLGGFNGGVIPGNIGGIGGGVIPGYAGEYGGGVFPGNVGGIMGGYLGNIRSYISGYINGRLSNGGSGGVQTKDNTHNTRN